MLNVEVSVQPRRPEDARKDSTAAGPVKAGQAPKLQPTVLDEELEFVPDIVKLKPNSRLEGTPYDVVRWLGEGGMGVVFEAHHTDLDRRVALKILRADDNTKAADLFRQEAKALAKVGSDYVVRVFDFVRLRDGRLMIAMELIDGLMLSEITPRSLTLERVIPILRQACKGLAAAHKVGIIHRDIKPANIALVRREGRSDAVTLLDFGVAQFQGSGAKKMAGTPGYVAPEVIGGLEGDARADLYALGCVAYYMVAGRPPFTEKDPSKLLLAHLSTVPERPSLFADVPGPIDELIIKCLEKDPKKRFASAEDLEAALCEAQIALGIETPWDDLPIPDVDPKRRGRLLENMPELVRTRPRSRLTWVLAAAAVLVGVVALPILAADRDAATTPAQAEVDELTYRAKSAAARAFFVYPPPERPEEPTAFRVIRELEGRAEDLGDVAKQRATALRAEFADTLERLGNQYWQEEGGRPFALDYYAQALVFDPERQQARERAMMSPGEFRLFRQKAETADFSPVELEAAEPLLVLADVDEAEKEQRLERMEEREDHRPASTTARLERLVPKRKRRRAKPTPQPETTAPPAAAPPVVAVAPTAEEADAEAELDEPVELAEQDEPEQEDEPAGSEPKKQEPDRDAARELTKEAEAARRRGDARGAEKLYAQALAADRRYAPAFAGLARMQYDAGKYSLAARTAQRAVKLAAKKAEYRILLGDALYKTYDRTGAKNQYLRAKELGHPLAEGRLAKVAK